MIASSPSKQRRRLKGVTLWSCAHNDAEYLRRTILVLKFCEQHFEFDDVLLLTHLDPAPGAPSHWRIERRMSSTPAEWNRFHIFSVPSRIHTAFALSVHEDGFPIQPELWSEDFLAYDYIGAPWPDGIVGNGGFCLESKKLLDMKLTLQIPMSFIYPSDMLICKLYRPKLMERGIRFAPTDVALRFSTAELGNEKPSFGFHGRIACPEKYRAGWEMIEDRKQQPKPLTHLKVITNKPPYYHSGKFGDIIYALNAIKLAGGGILWLGPEQIGTSPAGEAINEKGFSMLVPLIEQQSYISELKYVPRHPRDAVVDLNEFRNFWFNADYRRLTGISNLCHMHCAMAQVTEKFCENDTWLDVEPPIASSNIIIHRSDHYHGQFQWSRVVKEFGKSLRFVGSQTEHAAFIKAFGWVEYLKTPDALHLARLIAGSRAFIGNNSFPCAVAIGCGQRVWQEVWDPSPDTIFKRPGRFLTGPESFEEFVRWMRA